MSQREQNVVQDEIINIGRETGKQGGRGSLSSLVRRMQRSSRIKIEAEARIMHKAGGGANKVDDAGSR